MPETTAATAVRARRTLENTLRSNGRVFPRYSHSLSAMIRATEIICEAVLIFPQMFAGITIPSVSAIMRTPVTVYSRKRMTKAVKM